MYNTCIVRVYIYINMIDPKYKIGEVILFPWGGYIIQGKILGAFEKEKEWEYEIQYLNPVQRMRFDKIIFEKEITKKL